MKTSIKHRRWSSYLMGPVLLIAILVLARWEFDVELSFIFVLSAIVILISIIWFYAVLLNQRDAQRKEAVDELIRIKKVEEELRREQYLLRTLIDNLPDNIYAKDKDLKYTISNRAHAKMMGVHSREEVIGKTVLELMGLRGLNFDQDDHEVLTSGKPITRREETFVGPSGEMRWLLSSKIPFSNKSAEVIGLMGTSLDITDQKSSELKIKKALEKFDILSKATNDAIWDWSIVSDIKVWNHAMKTVFGYGDDEIGNTGYWWMQKIHPGDFDRVQQEIQDAIENKGTNWASTYRYRCANGTYKYVFDRGYVIYEDGKPSRMLGAMQDIDERMQSLEEVRKLSMVASKTDNMVLITDRENRIEWVNESFTRLMGFTLGEVIGKKTSQFLHGPETDAATIEHIDRKMKAGESALVEIVNYSRSGRKYWIRGSTTPIFNESGELDKFISIQSDITELIEHRQNLEEKVESRTRELHQALQKEKELVEMKNKFVSMVSHEFRTPLSSISLASGFIRRYRSKISVSEMVSKLENIEKQVHHMSFLLEDILTIGKSEAGKIQTQFLVLPVKEFFTNLIGEVEQSNGGTHTVKLKFGKDLVQIESDEKLLRNIIINLVTNAIKFSPDSKMVNVSLSRLKGHLHIQVKDHGIGIPPQDRDTIFTAFNRGSNVGTVRGTGLGLSIVKKAIELLKGDIQVKSRVGKGTLFSVTLPLYNGKENSADNHETA